MPQKPRLALYEHEAEMYLANLLTRKGNTASDSEKQKTRKALAKMTAILHEQGRSWPDESDYDTYRGGNDDKATKDNVTRIEQFFAWLKEEKETERMPENETTTTIDAESVQPETWPESESDNEPVKAVKKKPGRKVFDTENGEKKSEKLMLYLTPQLIAEIRTWCDLKGISAVSYITALIEADLDSKKDKINAFLEMRNNL